MIEGVIAYAVTCLNNFFKDLRMLPHIIPYTKESCFSIILLQRPQHELCGACYRAVIKREKDFIFYSADAPF